MSFAVSTSTIRAEGVPATIGRFSVRRQAGAGAMGVVHEAYDPVLQRRVALKVLQGMAASERARERARREAQALAQLSHPNVVAIYEIGEAAGQIFIAMEYVDGPDLTAWLAEAPRTATEIIRLFLRLGRGLAAAHDQGLVHRDFKPGNVLIGTDGRPRVIDFGLARWGEVAGQPAIDHSQPIEGTLTHTDQWVGTPAYMAPELLDGGEPTPASDQFAYCVALFEALYQRPPFALDSLPMLRRAMMRGPELPTEGAVPEAVAEALRRGLAADPTARWPSMAALLEALALVGEPPIDPHQGIRIRIFLAVAGLVATALGGLRVVMEGPPRDIREVAVQELMLGGVGVVLLVALRRWFAANALNRRLRTWVILLTAFRAGGFLLDLRLGLGVDEAYMVDALLMLSILTLHRPYVGFPIRLSIGGMSLALLGIFLVPSCTLLCHHIGGLLMLLGLLRGEWVFRKAERVAGLTA